MSIVNTDAVSNFVSNQINTIERALSQSIMKISSGSKLLTAADNPSDMIAQSNFNAHLTGIRTATYNAEKLQALLETANESLTSISDGLMIMRDDALKAQNDATLTAADFTALNNEFQLGIAALQTKAAGTVFNGIYLFSGSYTGKTAQIGPYAGDKMSITLPDVLATAVTPLVGEDISSAANASAALAVVDNSIDAVSSALATVGTYMKSLTIVTSDLMGQETAITSALNAVQGVDYAAEISNFSNLSIQSEAATSILANTHKVDEMLVGLLKNMS